MLAQGLVSRFGFMDIPLTVGRIISLILYNETNTYFPSADGVMVALYVSAIFLLTITFMSANLLIIIFFTDKILVFDRDKYYLRTVFSWALFLLLLYRKT